MTRDRAIERESVGKGVKKVMIEQREERGFYER
jgi:hypothetical protein